MSIVIAIVLVLFIAVLAVADELRIWHNARVAVEEKSYNEVEDAGYQFRTGDTYWSSSAPATVTTIGNLVDAKMTYINLTAKSRKDSLEDRRRVRIMTPHRDLHFAPDSERPSEMEDYHEWVPIWDEDIYADTLCRQNGTSGHVWRLWVCNNTDCGAQAYVAEEKIEETVQGWLNKAAPKPGQPVLPTYSPWSVGGGYSQGTAGASMSWTQPLNWTYMTDGES